MRIRVIELAKSFALSVPQGTLHPEVLIEKNNQFTCYAKRCN
jgi:hypothetical protein